MVAVFERGNLQLVHRFDFATGQVRCRNRVNRSVLGGSQASTARLRNQLIRDVDVGSLAILSSILTPEMVIFLLWCTYRFQFLEHNFSRFRSRRRTLEFGFQTQIQHEWRLGGRSYERTFDQRLLQQRVRWREDGLNRALEADMGGKECSLNAGEYIDDSRQI